MCGLMVARILLESSVPFVFSFVLLLFLCSSWNENVPQCQGLYKGTPATQQSTACKDETYKDRGRKKPTGGQEAAVIQTYTFHATTTTTTAAG